MSPGPGRGPWLRLYGALLRCYPARVRDGVGPEMERAFRRVVHGGGGRARARTAHFRALREIGDLALNLAPAWWNEKRRGSGVPGDRYDTGTGGVGLMGFGQELRQTVRALARRPGFTAAVVLTLGLAVGANAAVFSLVDGILVEPLPYPEPGDLVYMYESFREDQTMSVAYPNYRDWRAMNRTFRDMAARTGWSFTLTGRGDARMLSARLVSANLLPLLGVEPALGRAFTPTEEAREERLVLLSHGLWSSVFGSDPSVVGETVTLDGEPHLVLGVMPEGLEFPLDGAEVFAPLTRLSPDDRESRHNHPGISVLGRLQQEVTVEEARQDMDRIAEILARRHPESNAENGVVVRTLKDRVVGDADGILLLVQGAVALVFLIACANVANLALIRSVEGHREAGIRAALGAGRLRIVARTLGESLILALGAGGLGAVLGHGLVAGVRVLDPGGLPRLQRVEMDGSVLLFTVAAALAAGVLSGLVPGLRAARVDVAGALGSGSDRGASRSTSRFRAALIVTEVALTFVLLAGAGLMLRTTLNLLAADPGLDTDGVLTAQVPLGGGEYEEEDVRIDFYRQLLERVSVLPGVEAAAGVDPVPMGPSNRQSSISGEGQENVGEGGLRVEVAVVTPGYFGTVGIPLLRGRTFTGLESPDDPVVIVDESLVERLWPGEDPLGRIFKLRFTDGPFYRVVGVVGHVKNYGVGEGSRIQAYFPYTQHVWSLYLVARTGGDPGSLVPGVRTALAELDPEVPLTRIRPMAELERETMAGQILTARILGAFASVSLFLALLGLYGVVAYSVSLRTREIGIRMALGAGRKRILVGVARGGAVLVGLGLAAGIGFTAAATRTLSGLLFGVGRLDPATLTLVALLLGGVALGAALIPARRAVAVDPTVALKEE